MARLVLLIALALAVFSSTYAQRKTVGIIGGVAAKRGQFPYQVSLQYSSGSQYCGGSIITTLFIVTAAHCEMKRPTDFRAVAGALSYINFSKESGQVRGIVKFVQHENFKNVGSGWDVALAKVDQPFTFNSFIQPIPLCPTGTDPTGSVVASGWGLTVDGDNNSIPELLQTVALAMVSTAECSKKWGGLPAGIICASLPGKDTCQGDSGGPLVANVNNAFVLHGITSFGAECASKTLPGVYTNVCQYKDWISKTQKVI